MYFILIGGGLQTNTCNCSLFIYLLFIINVLVNSINRVLSFRIDGICHIHKLYFSWQQR